MTEPKVSTVVLSYNRPKMLRQALGSIKHTDEIVLTDDGSDFDAAAVLAEFSFPKTQIIQNPRLDVEERMETPTVGALINRAVHAASYPIITYLCDDDLFTPQWIPTVKQFFKDNPYDKVVKAQWLCFKDNDLQNTWPYTPDWRRMTTGNFAHKKSLFTDEGLGWSEETVCVHDDNFLWNMHKIIDLRTIKELDVLAGYRREHPHNMLGLTTMVLGGNGTRIHEYKREAKRVLSKMLEE